MLVDIWPWTIKFRVIFLYERWLAVFNAKNDAADVPWKERQKHQSVHQIRQTIHQKHQKIRQKRQSVCGVIGASHMNLYERINDV